MTGMNAITGKPLGGIAHLRQSVGVILNTPVGSRVMRREFGSRVHELVDRPSSAALLAEINAAAADALGRWEPRLRLRQARARRAGSGHVEIDLEGQYLPDGRPVRLEGISLAAAAAGRAAEPEAPRGPPAAIRAALSGGPGVLAGKVIADQGVASRIRASLSGGPGTLSARVTAQPSSLVRAALSGGPGTLSAAVTAEAVPAPEPAGTHLHSIPARPPEYARALITAGGAGEWYRASGEIGSYEGDLLLDPELHIVRIRVRTGPDRFAFNTSGDNAGNWLDVFGAGLAVYLLFGDLAAPLALPLESATTGPSYIAARLDGDGVAALAGVGAGDAVNLVVGGV